MAGLVGGSAGLVYLYNQYQSTNYYKSSGNNNGPGNGYGPQMAASLLFTSSVPRGKSFKNYQEVYNAIAEKVREEDDADDGAGRYGLLCRLAWHSSGTFDIGSGAGGSFGGTMAYAPESSDPDNAGLNVGIEFLQEFADKYKWISRGDLWTLGGVVAVQEAGGPKIKWRPGRVNVDDLKQVPKNGFLPDATRDGAYVKTVFQRMGFNERETVALLGAHCLGKCHPQNSGFDGPWVPAFNMFTNDFYVQLLKGWHVRKWNGKKQYQDDETNLLMMLPADMALKEESYFLKYVKLYAKDEKVFFEDFSKAFTKLLENGINFKGQQHFVFQTLDEQEG